MRISLAKENNMDRKINIDIKLRYMDFSKEPSKELYYVMRRNKGL